MMNVEEAMKVEEIDGAASGLSDVLGCDDAEWDFEMPSRPPESGGQTLCGRIGRPHRMKRISAMKTVCMYPGCDGLC